MVMIVHIGLRGVLEGLVTLLLVFPNGYLGRILLGWGGLLEQGTYKSTLARPDTSPAISSKAM